jgi:hypothetical protein
MWRGLRAAWSAENAGRATGCTGTSPTAAVIMSAASSERVANWWFLRKHPDWRLRVRTDHHQAVGALLDDMVAAGTIGCWRPSIHEPETPAFGGESAMTIVHDLFCADSRGVLTYALQQTPEPATRDAAVTGSLDRGLRSILAQIMIFHSNRLGLSAQAQGVLAHAAKAAVLPRS